MSLCRPSVVCFCSDMFMLIMIALKQVKRAMSLYEHRKVFQSMEFHDIQSYW